MGFLRLTIFFFLVTFSTQSNSDILRKGSGGLFIVPGSSPQPRAAPVKYTKPTESSSQVANPEPVTTSQKISEEQKLEPATVYMGGNGQVRSGGGGSGMTFLNLYIQHSYSDNMPDGGTYHVGAAGSTAIHAFAKQRLDLYVEAESVDDPNSQFRRVVFYKTRGYDIFIEFIATFDSEDLYYSKLSYCTNKLINSVNVPCDKNEIKVKSKDLFGNTTESMRSSYGRFSKEELLLRVYNNGKGLLGLR